MLSLGRHRQTHCINRRTTQSIFRAFDFSKTRGTPLTHYVVIHLGDTTELSAATAFEKIRHKYRDWQNYALKKHAQTLAPVYVFTMENHNGNPHVNWAVHVPDVLSDQFEEKLHKWVDGVLGTGSRFRVHVQLINQNFAKRLAKYIVKGTDPDFVEHFHLQDMHAPQGLCIGKRAGVSPSLGPTARRENGFVPTHRRRFRPRGVPSTRAVQTEPLQP